MTEVQNVKADIKIAGMTCAMCVKAVESALTGLPGVVEARVNLGNETAVVEYDPETLRLVDMEKAVRDAGYEVIDEKTTIKVGGMTCCMCARTIEKALTSLPGVVDATVNLAAEKAYVTYNPRITMPADMRKAVEEAGYRYLGMEGEPGEDAGEQVRALELRARMKRVLAGFAVGIPLMVLMYLPVDFHHSSVAYLLLVVSTPVFLYVASPIFSAAWRALKHGSLNMDVMYSMGIGVSFAASVLGTFRLFLSREFMFYDSAILLAAFLSMGRYLEAKAKGRTGAAIKNLMGLQPRTAVRVTPDGESEIAIQDVQIDDIILVKPGERVPVDGEVVEGESFVDESMITGEPMPVLKEKGSALVGGTLNQNSVLRLTARKVGKDTVLAHIVRLVEEAQGFEAPGSATGRRSRRLFHSGGTRRSGACLPNLVCGGWVYALIRPYGAHLRARDCLSLCPRPRNPDGRHRGPGTGGGAGNPDQEWRGPRDVSEDHGRGPRQNGYPHQGPA